MVLIDIPWQPTERQLRQFGGICIAVLPAIGWLWGVSLTVTGVLALVGLMIGVVAWVAPPLVRPLFLVLAMVAAPIGMLIGELLMMLIFFGVFLPVGLAFRLSGRDALQRQLKRNGGSYWQPKPPPRDVQSYYRQS